MWRPNTERLAPRADVAARVVARDFACPESPDFSGIWAPLVTPFRDGRVDIAALTILARRLTGRGLAGIIAGGPVGEIDALSLRERLRIAAALCETTEDALPVLVCVRDIDAASAAREIGQFHPPVSGFVAPISSGLDEAATYDHLMSLADAAGVPVVPWDRGRGRSPALTPRLVERLHAAGRFPALMLDGKALERLPTVAHGRGPALLCCDENWLFVTLQLGGHGGVLGLANLVPGHLAQVMNLFRDGREDEAWDHFLRLRGLCEATAGPGRVAALKAALATRLPMTEDVRAPLSPVDAATRPRIGPSSARCARSVRPPELHQAEKPILMTDKPLQFVIPTYRLRDVGETVEAYDENFRRSGQTAPILVFDDSSKASHDKYFAALEDAKTHNDLFYVGPAEKEEFISYICKRLRDRKLDLLVRNLFRPSYGGNRNFTLMYTLGEHMVSADDDMRPYALIEDSPESLGESEISRGKLIPRGANGHTRNSYDVLQSFRDVLGKAVADAPPNYERGELLNDTAMDLESNTSLGLARENALFLQEGKVSKNAVVKMAQTFRTGTNDIDAADYIELFLEDHGREDAELLNDHYVLVNFRPCLTNLNWRTAAWRVTTTPPACRHSSRPGCGSRTTSSGSGSNSPATRPPTSIRRRPISRTTTCARRWRRSCSMNRSARCSSTRSAPACARSRT